MKTIKAEALKKLLDKNKVLLIDVRESAEHRKQSVLRVRVSYLLVALFGRV